MKRKSYTKKVKAGILFALIFAIVSGVFVFKSIRSKAADNQNKEVISWIIEEKNKELKAYDKRTVRVIVELNSEAVLDDCSDEELEQFEYDGDIAKKEEKILTSQEKTISKVEKITGTKAISKNAMVSNMFSINCKKNQIEDIKKVSGIKDVQIASEYTVCLENATKRTETDYVQETYGYKGEGVVVAVIDTGVNYNHEAMQLDNNDKKYDTDNLYYYSKKDIENVIDQMGYGEYFTEKVPYGYDYTKGKNEVIGRADHGFHVSGIIAANGQNATGFAPNAKILGLKVFDDYGYGTSDMIIKAIEDAIKLKADIINMSLGSVNGIIDKDDYLQKAVDKANECGILCCISAGNASASSCMIFDLEDDGTDRTDTGTVSSPSIATGGFSVASYNNDEEEKISYFSSWGTTTDLRIKPEISAPGDDIYSLSEGEDGYCYMSGTSMAAPAISGASALVLQSIREKDIHVEGNIAKFIKNIMMNTANPIYEEDGSICSVRQQGAGRLNTKKAIDNIVVATYNDEAKVELGEITESKDIIIKLMNYSDEDISYTIPEDKIYANSNYDLLMHEVQDAYISFENDNVTVKAGESVSIKGRVNIPETYPANSFAESFIVFESDNDKTISMPVLAFYGDWEEESILDVSSYESDNSYVRQLGFSYPTTILCDEYCNELGKTFNTVFKEFGPIERYMYDGNLVAFSPNGDRSSDYVYPYITQLRNAEHMTVKVLDSNKNPIRTLLSDYRYKKEGTLYDIICGDNIKFMETFCRDIKWDGKIYNKKTGEYETVSDGQYYISIQAAVHDKDRAQEVILPVKIDTVPPVVEGRYTIDKEGSTVVKFKCSDDLALNTSFYIFTNSESYEEEYNRRKINADGEYEYKFDDFDPENAILAVADMAGNVSHITLEQDENDEYKYEKTYINDDNNNFNDFYYDDYEEENGETKRIKIEEINYDQDYSITRDMINEDGTFTLKGVLSGMPTEFKVNGKDVTVNPETYEFNVDLDIPYGKSFMKKLIMNGDYVCLDSINPVYRNDIDIKVCEKCKNIQTTDKYYEVRCEVSSYIEGYDVFIAGDNVYNSIYSVSSEQPIVRSFTHKVKLEKGDNTIKIVVKDFKYNKTEKTIHVYYKE